MKKEAEGARERKRERKGTAQCDNEYFFKKEIERKKPNI